MDRVYGGLGSLATAALCRGPRSACVPRRQVEDKDNLRRLAAHAGEMKLHAGMPAEVYIKTAERTFFQYIVRPIHDSMMRAFRER